MSGVIFSMPTPCARMGTVKDPVKLPISSRPYKSLTVHCAAPHIDILPCSAPNISRCGQKA